MKTLTGFTLIEMLVVVAIIAILASIAFPSYQNYVTASRRADAIAQLYETMEAQERYFTEHQRYATDLLSVGYDASAGIVSEHGYYEISASACENEDSADECVLLTAVAIDVQAGQPALTLNSRGEKTPVEYW